eukprot:gnl/TRDRNA2_/TRDRNA2_80907_c0_seq2.p1 gnl/TRDRNA2_/TRDRNA2_80907_c0~~gnl/TRDRNA2_/TRDRNA2_80907_c0_seq2.p1  ORF type:complete len:628 (+),score=110.46 gnl/TRDRNA2_/TRDRNA2_80907_c0_seq2:51-1886(+)
MCAAAIGNTLSDALGIFSGSYVEYLAERAGFEEPELSRKQRNLGLVKAWQCFGQFWGVIVGCIFGMMPLLWIDANEGERLKREKEQSEVFQTVVDKVGTMLQAEGVALIRIGYTEGDNVPTYLTTLNTTPNLPSFHIDFTKYKGFMGHVATTGMFVNIADVREEPLYLPHVHDNLLGSGIRLKSLLCMPIFGQGHTVRALILVVNKTGGGEFFTAKDEDILSAICSHITVATGDTKQTFSAILDTCEQSMTQRASPQWNTTTKHRSTALSKALMQGISAATCAEASVLLLLSEKTEELVANAIDGDLSFYRMSVGSGVAGFAVERGRMINEDLRDASWIPGSDASGIANYQGSGLTARSVLCMPIFDSNRKCLGAIECFNKEGEGSFNPEDVKYLEQVASYVSNVLEGPDAGLNRALHYTRRRLQHLEAVKAPSLVSNVHSVVCFLERAQNLPNNADLLGVGIDPYVTLAVVRGDPLLNQMPGLERQVLKERITQRNRAIVHWSKSSTVGQDLNPKWDETISVPVPRDLVDVPLEELYLHVLLWDYDSLKSDDLVAQAAFPLSAMANNSSKHKTPKPYPLKAIAGQDGTYDLDRARIWVSCSRRDTRSVDV